MKPITPHTPTPWHVDACDDDLIFAENGLHIATAGNEHQEQAWEEIAANARFIAVACNAFYAMLEALECALDGLTGAFPHPLAQQVRIKRIRAAIAKAKGGAA